MEVAVELQHSNGNYVDFELMKIRKRKMSELEDIIEGMMKKEESSLIMNEEMLKWTVKIKVAEESSIVEFGEFLVSQLCFRKNHPILWKLLHKCLSSHLIPLHILSLLSSKVIPHCYSQPEAFRLFLELFSNFPSYPYSLDNFSLISQTKIIKSIDDAIFLTHLYGIHTLQPGVVAVLLFFSVLIGLIDCVFDDWGLHLEREVSLFTPFIASHDREAGVEAQCNRGIHDSNNQHRDMLRRGNSCMAVKVLVELTQHKKMIHMLQLVRLNFPEKFNSLLQRLHFFDSNRLNFSNVQSGSQLMERLSFNIRRIQYSDHLLNDHRSLPKLVDITLQKPKFFRHSKYGIESGCWVSFDIHLENDMDKQLLTKPAITMLIETIKNLKVINQASWDETFLALWLAGLRLVQREREPLEGPFPHLESRLCILLSIVPLAIASIMEDSEISTQEAEVSINHKQSDAQASIKTGLLSSIQTLGQFSALLCPPSSIVDVANHAATKAARFIYSCENETSNLSGYNRSYSSSNSGWGNMRHLIVEACIARNLIDTSVYFWPNYVPSHDVTAHSSSLPPHKSPWSVFLEGAPLDNSLMSILVDTPASSVEEIKRLYHVALNGSKEEKSAAAKVLCGASLRRGWNIQEHVLHYVVKLLSPPVPPMHSGPISHLADYMPMLNVLLFGISSVDTIHILSLHGVIPEVAGSLMPLCETFGSLVPPYINRTNISDDSSVYNVFSCAFLILLRLWRFYGAPMEQSLNEKCTFGNELSLEYILLLRNSRIPSNDSVFMNKMEDHSEQFQYDSNKPVYLDFYPKLRAWYCQNKSCVASPLSELSADDPVREVANKVLSMMYSRSTKSGSSSVSSPISSNSSLSGTEDSYWTPVLPAWEILEAIPYVLEAVLTACAHGRLSSRDLTTGLKDLIDFLPASIGSIISYLSAEITRGVWKPVPMNGIDWPSPAAIIDSLEAEMEAVLASAGVKISSPSSGSGTVTLPLPMAALVSLTITFKLNVGHDFIHSVVGPALENCASASPWPSISVVGSLWTQKVRRWHNFILVSSARSVVRQDEKVVVQLLRSCFLSYLGFPNASSPSSTIQGGVSSLLHNTVSNPNGRPILAPGFLFLRCYRSINVRCLSDTVAALVAEYARQSATQISGIDSCRLRTSHASLSVAVVKAKEVAMLGSSLLCVSGGMNLVQELYRETIPTWFISSRKDQAEKLTAVSYVLEGYALAYTLMLSGSFVWGVGHRSPSTLSSKRATIFGGHMDFVAKVLEGNLSLESNPSTWKAYVSCFLNLVVNFTPVWLQEVNSETLRKLAVGLAGWDEKELALSLLKRGGVSTIGSAVELIGMIA